MSVSDAEQCHPQLPVTRDGLRLVLETALDAVVVMGPDGVVADWNDRAVTVFGWSRDEAVGQPMADLIIPERYREAHRIGLQRYLKSRQGNVLGRRIELSGIRKNGEEFPVELSVSPIQDGVRILFLGCLRDLTEHYALHLARAEIARVTQRMAMDEVTASNRSRGQPTFGSNRIKWNKREDLTNEFVDVLRNLGLSIFPEH